MNIVAIYYLLAAMILCSYTAHRYINNRNKVNLHILILAVIISTWMLNRASIMSTTDENLRRNYALVSDLLTFLYLPAFLNISLAYASIGKDSLDVKNVFFYYSASILLMIVEIHLFNKYNFQVIDTLAGYTLDWNNMPTYFIVLLAFHSAVLFGAIMTVFLYNIKHSKSNRQKKYSKLFLIGFVGIVFGTAVLSLGPLKEYYAYTFPFFSVIAIYYASNNVNKRLFMSTPANAVFDILGKMNQAVIIIDFDFNVMYMNDSSKRFFSAQNNGSTNFPDVTSLFGEEFMQHRLYGDFSELITLDNKGRKRTLYITNTTSYDRWMQYEGSLLLFKDITQITDNHSEISEYNEHLKEYLNENGLTLKNLIAEYSRQEAYKNSLVNKYKSLSETDYLTRTLNRDPFTAQVNQIIDSKARKLALITLKIKDLKSINDAQGHNFGNSIIIDTASMISETFGGTNKISRVNSGTFLIASTSYESNEAMEKQVAQLAEKIKQYRIIDNYEMSVDTISGLAFYPEHGSNANELIVNSEIAMYSSDDNERAVTTFSEELQKEILDLYALDAQIINGCRKGEFVPYLQPIINSYGTVNKIVGYEALVRWNHPERGLLSPYFFVGVAEKTGSIKDISYVVIEKSCEYINIIKNMGIENYRVSINLSHIELKDPQFPEIITKLIKKHNVDPGNIEFEITERDLISDLNHTRQLLQELKSMGFFLSIDDFGTAYSSFNYLKMLPIDKVKIDKSFVDSIGADEKSDAILKSLINMTKLLDLETLAEGVEEKHELEFLVNNGCNFIQGYYFYKPTAFNELVENGILPEEVIS